MEQVYLIYPSPLPALWSYPDREKSRFGDELG